MPGFLLRPLGCHVHYSHDGIASALQGSQWIRGATWTDFWKLVATCLSVLWWKRTRRLDHRRRPKPRSVRRTRKKKRAKRRQRWKRSWQATRTRSWWRIRRPSCLLRRTLTRHGQSIYLVLLLWILIICLEFLKKRPVTKMRRSLRRGRCSELCKASAVKAAAGSIRSEEVAKVHLARVEEKIADIVLIASRWLLFFWNSVPALSCHVIICGRDVSQDLVWVFCFPSLSSHVGRSTSWCWGSWPLSSQWKGLGPGATAGAERPATWHGPLQCRPQGFHGASCFSWSCCHSPALQRQPSWPWWDWRPGEEED